MDSPPPLPQGSVFRHRDFSLIWLCRLFGNLALTAESVTIGWQVYAVARISKTVQEGAFLVGMVGLLQFVPMFLLTLVAGEAADRYDRRRILLIALLVEVVCVAALGAHALSPNPGLTLIFLLAPIFGAARTFFQPAVWALMPMTVPREELPRAVAWSSLSYQSASIIGPSIAGALCAIAPSVAFGFSAVLYLIAAGLVLMIRTEGKPERQQGSRIALIREGLAYVWTNKIVFGSISLDLFAVLLGGATALLPVFARDVLAVGPEGFGIMRAAPSVGAGIVAVTLAKRPLQRRAGHWMFGGVAVFALATIGFALSRSLWLSVIMLAILGAGDMVSVFIRQSLVQIVTPDNMRGRVAAVSGLFIGASNELGEFESGLAARFLGPVGACLFGGIGALIVTGLWAKLFPTLRKADSLHRPVEAPR
jgi:MFS family permease